MLRFYHCTTNLQYNLKYLINLQRNTFKTFIHNTAQSLKCTQKVPLSLCSVTKFGLFITSSSAVKLYFGRAAQCKVSRTRLTGYRSISDKDLQFDWNKLWHYLKPHINFFLAAILGALAVAILNIQIPQLMSGIVNVVARFSDTRDTVIFLKEIKLPALRLLSMYIAQSVFTAFYINMLSHLGERMAYNIKTDLFSSVLHQDIAFFDQQRTGEIINRLTSDVQDFKSSFKQVISGGLRATTQIIGCAISLIVISPQMTLVTLLCVPAVITTGSALGSLLRSTSRSAQAQIEKSTAVADEAVSNIRTVRAFAMEELELDMFEREAERALVLNERLGLGIGLFQGGANLFLNSMVLATLYMGGYLLSVNQLSPGQLMAFLMSTQTIQRSLAQISLLFGSVVRGMAAGARIFQYINLKPGMPLTGGKILPSETMRGEIEFKDVVFAYPTRPEQVILQNFNLRIPAGKTVAIVGGSGNGKSTVAALLERFYEVNKGSITLDGEDISELDPTWMRQSVLGYINQEPTLFATTIMENIRYGRPDATDTEVIEAAELANVHSFVIGFPRGYNTLVGERGTTLSGGQKQRIAIARALLKNPSVLILDEATSALDTESENIVQQALDKAREGRTALVIAHRLSTIKNAHIIVVLSKGRIVEMGTHEELKNLKAHYWSLNFQQNSGE
ncbi:hypothetical protein PPYR_00528 [Photinus pyralis]|uniref:Mitochondrial potassium channel ATP-binding subunit n=2 Tax=Photinus pyralis TaxID=7054 RepID=A0A1Y1LRP3_PHOPY|nr:hypothetical protein PPYR_00528 [Photinus pyralis]